MQQITLDIQSKFQKLLQVSIKHAYFPEGIDPDLTLQASPETQQFFSQFQLKSKFQGGTFDVGFKESAESNPFGKTDMSGKKVSLLMFNKSVYLKNYSDLPFDKDGLLYYFDNLNGQQKDDRLILHPGDSVKEALKVQASPGMFQYKLEGFTGDTNWSLKNQFGDVLINEEINVPEGGIINIDIRNEVDGLYELQVHNENQKIYKFNQWDLLSRRHDLIGIVDVFLSDQVPSGMTVVENDVAQKPHFEIDFSARSIFWHYVIVSQTNANLYSEHKIIDSNGEVEFTDPETYTLPRDQEAFRIRTKSKILAQKVQNQKFKLSFQKKQSRSRTFTLDLPGADITNINLDRESGEMYADVFIYV